MSPALLRSLGTVWLQAKLQALPRVGSHKSVASHINNCIQNCINISVFVRHSRHASAVALQPWPPTQLHQSSRTHSSQVDSSGPQSTGPGRNHGAHGEITSGERTDGSEYSTVVQLDHNRRGIGVVLLDGTQESWMKMMGALMGTLPMTWKNGDSQWWQEALVVKTATAHGGKTTLGKKTLQSIPRKPLALY